MTATTRSCGARPVAGGRSAAPADAGDRHRARRSATRAQSHPVVAGDARHPARTAHGIRGVSGPVQTGDGRALPETFRFRLEHEWTHLDDIEARLAAVTATRDEQIATGTDRVAAVARQLCTMRGVAETSAAGFSAELFGTRTFRNGRQIGAVLGWCPSPIGVTNACRTRGSAKPAARNFGGSACSWRGVGCAGNPRVP